MQKKKRELKHWDAYFAQFLELRLPSYGLDVQSKIKVGKLPLEIDVVVITKKEGNNLWQAHPLWKYLTDINIIEYKSPGDKLKKYVLDVLIIYALGYRRKKKIPYNKKITMWLILPHITNLLKNILKEQEYEIKKIKKGLYEVKMLFPLYIVELDNLPISKEYLELELFTKRKNTKKVIENVIEYNIDKEFFSDYLEVLTGLHYEEFLEVTNMAVATKKRITLSKREKKRQNKEIMAMLIKNVGKKELIENIGEDEVINTIGEDKIIKNIGEDKIIKSINKDTLIKYLETQGMKVIKE